MIVLYTPNVRILYKINHLIKNITIVYSFVLNVSNERKRRLYNQSPKYIYNVYGLCKRLRALAVPLPPSTAISAAEGRARLMQQQAARRFYARPPPTAGGNARAPLRQRSVTIGNVRQLSAAASERFVALGSFPFVRRGVRCRRCYARRDRYAASQTSIRSDRFIIFIEICLSIESVLILC